MLEYFKIFLVINISREDYMIKQNLVAFKEDNFTLNVQVKKETVWLSQAQICELFEKNKSTISRHLTNIFKEGELQSDSVVAFFATTASDGKTYDIKYYNLDAIISVGYRVKSARGIKFRQWANKILKDYLVDGYVVNIARLEKENNNLKELQNIISVVLRVALESDIDKDEIQGLLSVVKDYEFALDLLDQYDYQKVSLGNVSNRKVNVVDMYEVYDLIKTMRSNFSTELFGKEKDKSLYSSMNVIYQSAFGVDIYPSIEEKAANLLYFLVKNHSFIDGNKRIAATVFVYFLKKNKLYFDNIGHKRLSDAALVSLTLLIAQSKSEEKDILVKIVVNLILESDNNT
jgi:prophage maintenance system killer protein